MTGSGGRIDHSAGGPAAGGVDTEANLPPAVAAIAAKLGQIPDGARTFDVGVAEAYEQYRLAPGTLADLVAHGMPAAPGGQRFDANDLATVSVHAGVGGVSHALRRFLPRALSVAAGRRGTYQVSYLVRCGFPGHAGPCRYTLLLPDGAVVREGSRDATEQVLSTTVAFDDALPELPPAVGDVLEEFTGVDFAFLPEGARLDLDFIRRTHLGGCAGTSRMIVERCRERGIPARGAYGLLLWPPFAYRHHWAEVGVAGTWIPVDPVMISSLLRWGALDPSRWYPGRSFASVLWRVTERATHLIVHGETPVMGRFGVRLASRSAAGAPAPDATARRHPS